MIIVADTSPLNYLVLIKEIELLPKLFGRIIISPAVVGELQNSGTPDIVRNWINSHPQWLVTQNPSVIDKSITLGAGEREAISLAKEINADLILLDDRKARKIAMSSGLNTAGTLNILKSAAGRSYIELSESIQKLMQTNFRVAPALLADLLKRN